MRLFKIARWSIVTSAWSCWRCSSGTAGRSSPSDRSSACLGRAVRIILIALVIVGWWWPRSSSGFAPTSRATISSPPSSSSRRPTDQPTAEAAAAARAVRGGRRHAQAAAQRSGHSLYELPWYVIIGAPGSGKTTALVNSGLQFPIEQRVRQGRAARRRRHAQLRLVVHRRGGPARHRRPLHDAGLRCGGRQRRRGREFLALLQKYRSRRPINGVILAISAQDLMTQGTGGARSARGGGAPASRGAEPASCGIQLPVYVLVTKCDLVAGFTEYFDDLTQEGRAQVWGVTFPFERDRRAARPRGVPGGVRRAHRRG